MTIPLSAAYDDPTKQVSACKDSTYLADLVTDWRRFKDEQTWVILRLG